MKQTFLLLAVLMAFSSADAQHLNIKCVRKNSKAADCATIVFKSNFDSLIVTSLSSDSVYKEKGCDYAHVWKQYVDLRYEREQGDTMINRRFTLHTPYTEDKVIVVTGEGRELKQSVYEYKVRMFDYFPLRVACEVDVVRIKDYFGLRISAGKRWGGYLSTKFGMHKKEGFNADEQDDMVILSKKKYEGRIRNSLMAGVKYGIIDKGYPIYAYLGVGYGEEGFQYSNGKKKDKGRVAYYNDYIRGLESEIGINYVLFDFLSISMGTDCIFARRVAFDINITIGASIDLTQ